MTTIKQDPKREIHTIPENLESHNRTKSVKAEIVNSSSSKNAIDVANQKSERT